MKKALLAVAAAFALTSCAEDMGGYGPYYGGEMAYYDGFYGPFYNGYWGPGGDFYYADRVHHFHRDVDHHFHHHDPGAGFRGVRTHPGWVGHHGAPGGRTGDHDRDRPH
ncbi:MAG: hypothetical protein KGO51_06315 [Alphaproteobacteria bacterium]|nr:hypothetical protein [Alphaproteobacteria bacterium]